MTTDGTPAAYRALTELLEERHSCRGFLPDPLPNDVLPRIFTAAQRTASWCNTQPWQVHLIEGDALTEFRDALGVAVHGGDGDGFDLDLPEYGGVSLERRRAAGWALYGAVGVARGDRAAAARQAAENSTFFGAPHVAVVTTDAALGSYGLLDCGGWVANVLLAATSLGVATIAQASTAGVSPFVRHHFGIRPDRQVVLSIAFGREDLRHPANSFRTDRAGLDEVVLDGIPTRPGPRGSTRP